ncbi:GNAT family N-acetyltransferase [Paraburkholderia sp.]|uniref:GNAT family N-acetyltransferase n=1 Tax=Paraburkholderia sp. TaxID=1926495 RepID=UPI003D6E84B2
MASYETLLAVRSVPSEQVIPLRSAVLLDGHTEGSRFRGDDDPSTLHLAIYRSERIVAVATICNEAMPRSHSDTEWRLRGVAVDTAQQRYGLGRLLIKQCLQHAFEHGGRLAWCTARESARGFYEALGFASSTPAFKLPSKGDMLFYEMHYVLPGEPGADVE